MDGIRFATLSSLLISLSAIALLLILLPPVAGKLAGIITTPVEREQARRGFRSGRKPKRKRGPCA